MNIGNAARSRLERNIGLTIEEISNLTIGQEMKHVESISGSPISSEMKIDYRIVGRGNSLLMSKRGTSAEQVNNRIDNLLLKTR